MTFGFVSRALYDDVVGDLRRRLDEEQRQRAALLAELARVTDKLLPERKRTIDRPAMMPAEAEAERASFDERIEIALDSNRHTQRNQHLRARMRRWAEGQLAKQTPIEDIERRLVDWSKVGADDDVIALQG